MKEEKLKTVGELIKALQEYDSNLFVEYWDDAEANSWKFDKICFQVDFVKNTLTIG